MNFKNFFLAVLVSVIIAFSTTGNFSHTKEPTVKTFTVLISTLEKSGECTYARVFKDGIVDICIWWKYSYWCVSWGLKILERFVEILMW